MKPKKEEPKKEISSEELKQQLEVIEKAADDKFIEAYKTLCAEHHREFGLQVTGVVGEPLKGVMFVKRIK